MRPAFTDVVKAILVLMVEIAILRGVRSNRTLVHKC